ncbi:MAG: hypothetical protein D9N14_14665 [Ketobacter sp.]|nr:MAG: hypothetical protein D9N14_14665 [Ketobacter sp.]
MLFAQTEIPWANRVLPAELSLGLAAGLLLLDEFQPLFLGAFLHEFLLLGVWRKLTRSAIRLIGWGSYGAYNVMPLLLTL